MTSSVPATFRRLAPEGGRDQLVREIAVETPVAIEVNGIGYAVMMATPADLEDFARGFAWAERLVDAPDELIGIDTHEVGNGLLLRLTLVPDRAGRVADRVRHRVAESSCGLCGIENLEAALRPLPRVAARTRAEDGAIFRALGNFRAHQPLNAATGAVHGAALCDASGAIRLAREDVGRHNAFDKLIGAMLAEGLGWEGGFALLSARCSYELVEKAALAGCPMLVTVSAPTSLAIARAAEAGVRLVALARADAALLSLADGPDHRSP